MKKFCRMNLVVDFFLKNKMGHFHIIDFPMGGSENRRKHFFRGNPETNSWTV